MSNSVASVASVVSASVASVSATVEFDSGAAEAQGKYALCDWEINGRDDSDFMVGYYNAATDSIERHCYRSTRWGGCTCDLSARPENAEFHICGKDPKSPQWIFPATPEMVERARRVLARALFATIIERDRVKRDEVEPEEIVEGDRMVLTEKCRHRPLNFKPCAKCNGTGKWVNPRKETDKRECFYCEGAGEVKVKSTVPTKEQGWVTVPVGTTGTVINFSSYGQFYARGYNSPNRGNTTVTLRSDDGTYFRAKLEKLRADRDLISHEVAMRLAERKSYSYAWQLAMPGVRCAWLDVNFGANIAAHAAKANEEKEPL